MPGTARGNEAACDSRNASIGLSKSRKRKNPNGESRSSAPTRAAKRRRGGKKPRPGRRDTKDFVPKGTNFTNSPLPVNEISKLTEDANVMDTTAEPPSEPLQPSTSEQQQQPQEVRAAGNWNNVRKGAVRTSLRSQKTANAMPNSFQEVNAKFWRSRSASASSSGSQVAESKPLNGKNDDDGSSSDNDHTGSSISDGEIGNDNSIVLNMDPIPASEDQPGEVEVVTLQPTPVELQHPTHASDASKEEAFRTFHEKYNLQPRVLRDLTHQDLEVQAKYVYYKVDSIELLDLGLPVGCTDCLGEGHLAEICPLKECEHCGVWNTHESRFCPRWRRCQRCRERGHDKEACSAPLQATAAEVPCDLCASTQHLELDCDLLWKIPQCQCNSNSGKIFISVCCAHCADNHHLVGDCPERPYSMNSSSWSLKMFDQSTISNISRMSYTARANGPFNERLPELKVRGRANQRDLSSEDEGLVIGGQRPPLRQPPRSNIRIAAGIARNFQGPSNDTDRYVPHDNRRSYRDRDRDPSYGSHFRQRSQSPGLNYSNPQAENQYPPPKPPSRGGRFRGGKKRGGGGGGGGGGRDNGPPPNRNSYRPPKKNNRGKS